MNENYFLGDNKNFVWKIREQKTAKLLILPKLHCFLVLFPHVSFESACSQKSIKFSFILSMLDLTLSNEVWTWQWKTYIYSISCNFKCIKNPLQYN
jgi:hypothetical protein